MQLALNAFFFLQDLPGQDWQTAGPAAALIRSCKYVGWRVLDAYTIVGHTGDKIAMDMGSPCMLKHIYRARLAQVLMEEAFLKDFQEMGFASDCAAEGKAIQVHELDLLQAKQMINLKRQGLSSWQKQQLI